MSYGEWEPVIGLEIHAQLNTRTKMFSGDSGQYGAADNVNISPTTVGLPGALPAVNKNAIMASIRTGLALGCRIRCRSVFARKNYFYPDLPKGYQISQYDEPLCEKGQVTYYLDGHFKSVEIERAHMEEDAGKSIHHGDQTFINLNRAGVPLLEIVSGPDMRSPSEAAEYARTVRRILRYLEVCDGNLEEGSMRCDCNVSVRRVGEKRLGTKVELKNINSFRFIEKALEYEIERQVDALESGETIFQETRLYDSVKNRTFSMRSKEEAHDYRYFPDPDLLPVVVSESLIEKMKAVLPELPLARAQRFQTEYSLPEYDSMVLTQEKELAEYFEKVCAVSGNPKASSNWVMVDLMRELNESRISVIDSPIEPKDLGELISLIDNKTISGKMAKTIFNEMWKTGESSEKIINQKGLSQITDPSQLEEMVDKIIFESPGQVEQYKSGKTKVFGFFVGQVMKMSKGQANPEIVNQLLRKKLES